MIYTYDRRKWSRMDLPVSNELIRFIFTGVVKLQLENTRVVSRRTAWKESAERRDMNDVLHDGFHKKRSRKRQTTPMPWGGSPNYYGIADNSNMRKDRNSGEREFRERITNNVVYS